MGMRAHLFGHRTSLLIENKDAVVSYSHFMDKNLPKKKLLKLLFQIENYVCVCIPFLFSSSFFVPNFDRLVVGDKREFNHPVFERVEMEL